MALGRPVVLAVLVIGAALYYWHSTYSEDTDDAQVDGNLYQVSSRVTGQVVHVDVEEEQFVHKGDPIAEVDPKDYEVALEQADANLADQGLHSPVLAHDPGALGEAETQSTNSWNGVEQKTINMLMNNNGGAYQEQAAAAEVKRLNASTIAPL